MHTAIVIGVGLLVLAASLLVGRLLGGPGALPSAALVFLPVWLVAAGVNMAIFELMTSRSVKSWDTAPKGPFAARFAGAASIVIWVSVMFIARWIGFTKGYNYAIPEGLDLDLQFPGQ